MMFDLGPIVSFKQLNNMKLEGRENVYCFPVNGLQRKLSIVNPNITRPLIRLCD